MKLKKMERNGIKHHFVSNNQLFLLLVEVYMMEQVLFHFITKISKQCNVMFILFNSILLHLISFHSTFHQIPKTSPNASMNVCFVLLYTGIFNTDCFCFSSEKKSAALFPFMKTDLLAAV